MNMERYNWKLMYNYKLSFWKKVKMWFFIILAIYFAAVALALLSSTRGGSAFVLIFTLIFACLAWRVYYSYSNIKASLQKCDVEYFDKSTVSGLFIVKARDYKLGVFNPKTNSYIIPIECSSIKFVSDLIIVRKEPGWGVYNRSLSKYVLPCKYDGITRLNNGDIEAMEGVMKYTYTPYGTKQKVVDTSDKIGNYFDKMIEKSMQS